MPRQRQKVTHKKAKTLKQLKREAIKWATGYVRRIQINPYVEAYAYFRWSSDDSLDAYFLGYTPTKKVKDLGFWKFVTGDVLWDLIQDRVRDFIDEEMDACYEISRLCQEADGVFYEKNPEASAEEYNSFLGEFFFSLDDETEEARDAILDKYEKLIRKRGGEWFDCEPWS